MRNLIRLGIIVAIATLYSNLQAQNLIEYTLRVTSVTHNFQCGSDGFFSDPEPRWKIRGYHVGAAVPAYTVINLGTSSCGTYGRSDLLADYQNATGGVACADNFEIDYQSWEEDGCGSDNDFNGGGCANNDENDASATPTYAFSSYPQNVTSSITVSSANGYNFSIDLWWREITAPTDISTVVSGCNGATANLAASAPIPITGGDFYWYTVPTGGTSIATGSSYNPTISGSTTYYVAYGDGSCETPRTTITVTELASSVAPITLTASPTAICDAGTVDFTVGGGSLGDGAVWELYAGGCGAGAPVASSGTSSISTVPVTTTTDYYVLASGTCNTTGCAPGVTVDFSTSSIIPTGVTSSAGTSICSGTSTTLSITGGTLGTGANWEWWDGGCGIGANVGSGSSILVTPAVTTTYYVQSVSPGCGGSLCQSITITVNPGHVVPTSINASNNNFCVGGTVDLTQVGGTPASGADWEWYEGGCGIGASIGTGNTVTGLTPSATTTYYVRAEGGSCGTSACQSITITVDQLPTTANAGLDFDVCGVTGALSGNSPTIGSGVWNTISGPGNADSPGTNNSSISALSFVTPTEFEWVITNGSCPSSTDTVMVTAYDNPSASVAGLDQTQCDLTTATLAANTPTIGTGNWTVLAGGATVTSPGAPNSGVTGLTPGTNTFQWEISNGTCTPEVSTVNIEVEVSSTDPTSASAADTVLCSGQSTILQVVGGTLGTGASWNWYAGSVGGTFIGSGTTVSTGALTSTTDFYIVAEGNCNTTTPIVVTVTIGAGALAPVAADFTINNICPGDTSEVYVTGGPLPSGYTWVWYTGACSAVTAGVGDTLEVMPTSTTTYYVSAVGTCGASLCESVTVDVQNGSIAATSISSDNNNFCPGDSATLTVVGGSLVTGANWTWYENSCGGTAVGTGSTITVTPNNSTAYYVRAEGGTCGNTACADILVNVLDAYAYLIPFDTLCGIGSPFELNNGLPVGGLYSGTGVVGGNFDPSVAGLGTHTITYDYTSPDGCLVSLSEDIVLEPSSLSATATVSVEPCAEGGVSISVNASGGTGFYNYNWNDGSSENPYTYADPGTYDVTVSDGTSCMTAVTGIVVTSDLACVEVPNSFTPNGDGMNDTWNLDFSAYSNRTLQIFSKWGTLVFESNETNISWDGRYDGDDLPAGTYYYILKLDSTVDQNGPITIVR